MVRRGCGSSVVERGGRNGARFQIFSSPAWYAMAATGLAVVAASLLLWWCVVVAGRGVAMVCGGEDGGGTVLLRW
ncbi:hypothetical protein DEO72_LG10g2325 [Vigna unguiculata]|uniref:Uncharacterized protein n=1 Tax=Vigna unguiculata TaxID=3917 RepID=A0A4D6NDX4_VIGUN|nr:hypothetical protein DEO72_LG10g2325 [Vigna unguiculata]